MPRPHVLLSAAVSLDGCLDDTGPRRLLLSGPEDFDRVDAARAGSDAVLVGAGTLRADRPRLLVNSERRRAQREAEGRPAYPLKVAVSGSGRLDPADPFWTTGGDRLVYTTDEGGALARERLGAAADVVTLGAGVDWARLLDDLGER
ncbi:5-amino-6-(5-phosphoribosylamino)uracil reductase, partial [Streptomyces sp. SID5785]|uniref:RibD family protein n=1 Tax=Streptomyces sp. SID5785 TaxID=2690309 RepID=UPI001361C416